MFLYDNAREELRLRQHRVVDKGQVEGHQHLPDDRRESHLRQTDLHATAVQKLFERVFFT